jgi:ADP-ribose pyrophosphatase
MLVLETKAVSLNLTLAIQQLLILGLVYFALHLGLYFAFLYQPPSTRRVVDATDDLTHQTKEPSMLAATSASQFSEPLVKILDMHEEYSLGNMFRIVRAELQYRRFDGRLSDPITRISFERGDSVGVLLYDPQADAVILVRQFRYPVYASLAPAEQVGEGTRQAWLLEIIAGVKEVDRSVKEVANMELLEEAGYVVKGELRPITTIYPSPGGSSERIHLFLGEVDAHQRVGQGGGVAAEGEDTQIVVLPFAEALDKVTHREICDAKTIVALQQLALQKTRDLKMGIY